MPPIPNPEFPDSHLLTYMLLVAGGIVAGLILMTLILAIITYVVRFVFIPRERYLVVHNGVEELERYGFEVYER
jgi:hypothetical protein